MIKEQFNLQSIIMHHPLKERPKRIIFTSNQNDQKYIKMLRGERSDTKELNINIKTLTLSHLRDLQTANQLTNTESQIVKNYSQMSPSFHSISYLFLGKTNAPKGRGNNKIRQQQQNMTNQTKEQSPAFKLARNHIRQYCQAYYRSNYFIRQFLRSSRMNFKNKLIIIKFLNKIECLTNIKVQFQWKNIAFSSYDN